MSSEPRPAYDPDGSRMTLHGIPIMICDDMAPGTIVLTDKPGEAFDPEYSGNAMVTNLGVSPMRDVLREQSTVETVRAFIEAKIDALFKPR